MWGKKMSPLMALDQSQEHNIKFPKEYGEPKWLNGQQKEMIELFKPDVLWVADEFENQCIPVSGKGTNEHSESSVAEQANFL